jgi:hypothetical protein
LIVALAGSLAKTDGVNLPERDYVVNKILDGKLKSVDQVSGIYRLLSAGLTRLTPLQSLLSTLSHTKYPLKMPNSIKSAELV